MKPELLPAVSISIFLCLTLITDKVKYNRIPFKFTDIFHYEKPAKESDYEKKQPLNFYSCHIGKKLNIESVSTTYTPLSISF